MKMSADDKKHYGDEEGKWRAESDMNTLIEAKKIMKDSKRKDAAMYCARQHKKALNEVTKE